MKEQPEDGSLVEVGTTDFAGMTGNSISVATWTMVSRFTGLLRVVAIAAVLGPTFFGNVYQSTNLIPNYTYEFLTGSLFASLLVPTLVQAIDAGDRQRTERLAGGFLGLALLGFATVATVVAVGGPLLLRLFTVGLGDPDVVDAHVRVGWPLLALLIPQVLFYGVVGTGVAVQNARGRFAWPAAAPAIENLGVITTLLASGLLFGSGTPLREVTTPQILLLGGGTTLAVALHAAGQWWGALRAGVRLVPRWGWRDREVRHIVRLAVPSLGYSGLNAVRFLGIITVASSVPGAVVAFQLAVNFFNLPVAIGARPIAQALLPELSRFHHAAALERFRSALVRGASLMFFITVPAAIAYLTLARPLALAVSFGEMATPTGVTLIAASLAALALGVLGESGFVLAMHASYARHDAKSPLWAMGARVGCSLIGMACTLMLFEGTAVVVALGLTVSAADLIAALLLYRRVGSSLPQSEVRLTPALLRAVGAGALMAGPAYLTAVELPQVLPGRLSRVVAMFAAALVGLAVFLATQRLLRSPELSELTSGARSLRPGRADRRP